MPKSQSDNEKRYKIPDSNIIIETALPWVAIDSSGVINGYAIAPVDGLGTVWGAGCGALVGIGKVDIEYLRRNNWRQCKWHVSELGEVKPEREPGWYWVKGSPHSAWKPAFWSGRDWALVGLSGDYFDEALHEIGPPANYDADERIEQLENALRNLLKYAERKTCLHEETYRGGVLWTICSQCGMKWADDEGGMPETMEPAEITTARSALEGRDDE